MRNQSNQFIPNLGGDAMGTIFFILILALFAISLYVFLVLCLYVCRFFQKRRSRVSITLGRANGFGKIALAMRLVAVTIAAMCLIHFILEQAQLFTSNPKPFKTLSLLTATMAMMLSYIFFWLRQRVLYDAPAMKLFSSKVLRVLSWLSLVFVALNSVSQFVLTIILQDAEDPIWIHLSWLLGCLVVQGSLMSLFLYPLLKHISERRAVFGFSQKKKKNSDWKNNRTLGDNEKSEVGFGIRDSNIFTVSSSRQSNGSISSIKRRTLAEANPMYRAARRCVVCASIAFLTDILVGVFIVLNHHVFEIPESKLFPSFFFDFNLVVNSIVVVGCFSNWRYILLPKCYSESSSRESFGLPAVPEAVIRQRSLKVKLSNGVK